MNSEGYEKIMATEVQREVVRGPDGIVLQSVERAIDIPDTHGELTERLKSRKLIMTVVGAAVVVVNELLGSPLDDMAVVSVTGMIAAYVLGQGYADGRSRD